MNLHFFYCDKLDGSTKKLSECCETNIIAAIFEIPDLFGKSIISFVLVKGKYAANP